MESVIGNETCHFAKWSSPSSWQLVFLATCWSCPSLAQHCPKALRSERAPSARPNRRFSDCSQIGLSWRTTALRVRSERCSFNFGIAILVIWSAVGVQFRYLWVRSERSPGVWEWNLSATLLFGSAIWATLPNRLNQKVVPTFTRTAFIDLKKAYDSIDRHHLWDHLNNIRMPQKIVRWRRICLNWWY